MSSQLVSLPPVVSYYPKVLILGSMPSVQSLEKQQYYGNPRNHFWPIMFKLFKIEPIESYEEKITFIKQKGMALWDTIGSCEREGSLDTHIKKEKPNDIRGFIMEQPSIRLIACNGTKSYQMLKKYIPLDDHLNIDVLKLPSTSPIPGRFNKTFPKKVEEWRQILAYL